MKLIFQCIIWSIIGVIIYRQKIVSANVSSLIAKALYWVGVPLQIFFLVRNSDFGQVVWLPPVVSVLVLLLGLGFTLVVIGLSELFFNNSLQTSTVNEQRNTLHITGLALSSKAESHKKIIPTTDAEKGSFILCSILGSTGFIGLSLVPSLVARDRWSWIVLYVVAHNILGSYGLGALIAEHFSSNSSSNDWLDEWLDRLQSLVLLPSLWAFACGYFSQNFALPYTVELFVNKGTLLIIPGAFVLIGIQLSELGQWRNLRLGIVPAIVKIFVLPCVTGLLLTFSGFRGDSRLVLVLMSGMPTAFASIILAETYNLERNIAASSILLSVISMPISLCLWLNLF